MSLNALLSKRNILSETKIPEILLKKCSDNYIQLKEYKKRMVLDHEIDFYPIVENIKKSASSLVKEAQGNLEKLPNGVMYDKLDDRAWFRSAMAVEIFRNHSISKNSDRLDTLKLQEKFHELMKLGKISLVIGWGQPKRSCGGLKTSGAYADFSEFYATARLQMIGEALHLITGKDIEVTALTGGSRFYESFFTPPSLTKEYDHQRNIMASYLKSQHCQVIYKPYNEEGFELDLDMKNKINQYSQNVNEYIAKKYINTIILNIYWNAIISKNPSVSPHGLTLPENVKQLIDEKGIGFDNLLIRAGIVSIIVPETYNKWVEEIGSEAIFDDLLSFMYQVVIQSTLKYIAIHQMDSDIEKPGKDRGLNQILRMTVHEKKDRLDIPAIFILGINGGNLLPQHVISYINEKNEVLFMTNIELEEIDAYSVNYDKDSNKDGLFSWLKSENQPIFYTFSDKNNIQDMLQKVSID